MYYYWTDGNIDYYGDKKPVKAIFSKAYELRKDSHASFVHVIHPKKDKDE